MSERITYEEAIEIRAKWLKLQEQLPQIIKEAKKGKSVVQIAKDFQYDRTHIYNILEGA